MGAAPTAAVTPRAWLLAVLDLVFPAVCPVCERRLGEGRRDPLCGACWDGIARLAPPWCERCGRPVPAFDAPAEGAADACDACLAAPPAFQWARAAAAYDGVIRDAIHALKFGRRQALARPLADLVVEQLGRHVPAEVDALVPVPLAPARERERGFNQAGLLADRIGARLGLPVREGWLRRARTTVAQTELSAAERRANVRDAFAAAAAVGERHVVVVDDVLTTGATAGECARALRAAGARSVGVLTVARVPSAAHA